jgi:chemotaxis family two-component system sensor kinase Cph1
MMAPQTTHVDLSNCEREPIHLSGSIQPHGILLALDNTDLRVVQASSNVEAVFGKTASALLGRPVDDVLGATSFELIRAAAQRAAIEDTNPLSMSVNTLQGDRPFDAVLHRSSGQIVVELEPLDLATLPAARDFHRIVRGPIEKFASVQTVLQLCAAAVAEVARVTGFDRVMVYRFDEDWHGEVIAESRSPAMEPFLGLHYPASDIPSQARALFKRNWLRFIPDVGYVPAVIVPSETPAGGPLDLSQSVLRSVSPLHIEYLQNMGVGATMTISLLKNGELWGLIACHHRAQKMISYQVRFACEIIGRTMSLHLGSLEENEDTEYRMTLKSAQTHLFEALSKDTDLLSALASAEPDLLSLVGAEGAAICFGDGCELVGKTPDRADVMAIIDWLAARDSSEILVTDALPLVAPRFEALASTACGIIAVPLSRTRSSYVVWFRPELLLSVNWAGNPEKKPDSGPNGIGLTPRSSFAQWTQIVQFHSRRWQVFEIDAAREWCRFVATLIVDRAEQLERTNRDLAVTNNELASLLRSNVELDSFAHIASHDLKEPLRGIHNYAGFLIEDYGTAVGQDGREKLETLVRLALRMERLIDSLLALSSVGRADFVGSSTDLRTLVDEVLEAYRPRLAECGGSVSFVTPLPEVNVDPVRLSQVFNNLFSNALKYRERAPQIEIGIDPEKKPPPHVLEHSSALPTNGKFVTVFVRDNGIGIRERHLTSIFQMFKRLHAADAYGGGTGAGLAIASKIVERHAGHMWAESTFGGGTTFYFTLPVGT